MYPKGSPYHSIVHSFPGYLIPDGSTILIIKPYSNRFIGIFNDKLFTYISGVRLRQTCQRSQKKSVSRISCTDIGCFYLILVAEERFILRGCPFFPCCPVFELFISYIKDMDRTFILLLFFLIRFLFLFFFLPGFFLFLFLCFFRTVFGLPEFLFIYSPLIIPDTFFLFLKPFNIVGLFTQLGEKLFHIGIFTDLIRTFGTYYACLMRFVYNLCHSFLSGRNHVCDQCQTEIKKLLSGSPQYFICCEHMGCISIPFALLASFF